MTGKENGCASFCERWWRVGGKENCHVTYLAIFQVFIFIFFKPDTKGVPSDLSQVRGGNEEAGGRFSSDSFRFFLIETSVHAFACWQHTFHLVLLRPEVSPQVITVRIGRTKGERGFLSPVPLQTRRFPHWFLNLPARTWRELGPAGFVQGAWIKLFEKKVTLKIDVFLNLVELIFGRTRIQSFPSEYNTPLQPLLFLRLLLSLFTHSFWQRRIRSLFRPL